LKNHEKKGQICTFSRKERKKKEPLRQNTHHPSLRITLGERKCSGAFKDMVEGHA
jgi:hypothetical protein